MLIKVLGKGPLCIINDVVCPEGSVIENEGQYRNKLPTNTDIYKILFGIRKKMRLEDEEEVQKEREEEESIEEESSESEEEEEVQEDSD